MTITYDQIISISDEQLPVFRRYEGHKYPQIAYIQMTAEGEISADYGGDNENVAPPYDCNDRILCWFIDPYLTGDDILSLVDENLALFERVHAGHSIDRHKNAGRLTNDAYAASNELVDVLGTAQSSI